MFTFSRIELLNHTNLVPFIPLVHKNLKNIVEAPRITYYFFGTLPL